MQDQLDSVDRALESLRGRQWPGDYDNQGMKDRLMQEFATERGASRLGRRGVLIATLAVLVVGSAGFAAAGGVEMIKSWFMTVTVKVDGETVAAENVTADEDGRATIALPAGSMEGGKEVSLTIVGEGAVGEPGVAKTVTIGVSAEDDVAHIQVEEQSEGNDEEQTQTP